MKAVTGTRTYDAALVLTGRQPGLDYALSTGSVLVTIAGPIADLDRIDPAAFTVTLDVAGLGAGAHELQPTPVLQAGLRVLSVDPADGHRDGDGRRQRLRPAVGGTLMARLFGTDGIRGVANVELKPTLAYALGRATAHRLVGKGGSLVVGQDTRRSGDMFVAAIAAGATSLGSDVRIAGCVPTPALAFLAGTGDFAAGIMVSASHNPADDNGLKVLDANGLKLDDAVEDEIEQLIWRTEELGSVGNAEIGRSVRRSVAARPLPRASPRARRAPSPRPACGSSSTARTAPAASSRRRSSRRPGPTSRRSTTTPTG